MMGSIIKKVISFLLICIVLVNLNYKVRIYAKKEEEGEAVYEEEEDHPNPNDEHYEGMIYVGRLHEDGVTRVGWHEPNGTLRLLT